MENLGCLIVYLLLNRVDFFSRESPIRTAVRDAVRIAHFVRAEFLRILIVVEELDFLDEVAANIANEVKVVIGYEIVLYDK